MTGIASPSSCDRAEVAQRERVPAADLAGEHRRRDLGDDIPREVRAEQQPALLCAIAELAAYHGHKHGGHFTSEEVQGACPKKHKVHHEA